MATVVIATAAAPGRASEVVTEYIWPASLLLDSKK